MKFSIDAQVKDRLEALISWIDKRSEDKIHEKNGDVIADFLDKFLVVEMKRLENKPEVIQQDIEIPDKVMLEPLTRMKEAVDGAFDTFMSGRGITVPQSGSTPEEEDTATQTAPVATANTPRTGNGHSALAKRKLNDPEKNYIRQEFMALNGEFKDAKKSCTAMLPQMGADISVWQITGFVSYLHREIAADRLQVPDMPAYLTFLEAHKKLWAQYNSPKYQNLRANPTQQQAQTSTTSTTPKFRQGTFKQKTV